MVRVEAGKNRRREFLPCEPQDCHNGEGAGDSNQRTCKDVQRPVNSNIHSAECYQKGGKKRNPAPASVEEKANRRHGEAIRGVRGGEGFATGGGGFNRGGFDPQRQRDRQHPRFRLCEIDRSDIGENLVRPRAIDGGFQVAANDPVVEAHGENSGKNHRPRPESSEQQK